MVHILEEGGDGQKAELIMKHNLTEIKNCSSTHTNNQEKLNLKEQFNSYISSFPGVDSSNDHSF